MGKVSSIWFSRISKLASNHHFWLLTIIIGLIALLYYSWVYLDVRYDWLWRMAITEFRLRFAGSLFLLPIIYAAVIFRWRGMLVVWVITMILTAPMLIYYGFGLSLVLINIFYLCVPLLIAGYINLEFNWRDSQRRLLLEREEERRAYVAQVFQAQEDERKRIAQELHDDAIHSLLVIANDVQKIAKAGNNQTEEQLDTQTATIRGDITRVADDLRRLTLDLRPGILDDIGFLPALRWLVDRLHQDGNIDAKMTVNGKERKIPYNADVIMFRIVQELLNNVRRHSMATEVIATVEFGDETVKISVCDNGKGFTLPKRMSSLASKGQLGLIGIRERVHSLNGKFEINSEPGKGTTAVLTVTPKQ